MAARHLACFVLAGVVRRRDAWGERVHPVPQSARRQTTSASQPAPRSGRVQLTNSQEVARSDRPALMSAERDDRLSVTRGGYELDLDGVSRVNVNDRADVSALQPVAWQVSRNDYGVEGLERHDLQLWVCGNEPRCPFTRQYKF